VDEAAAGQHGANRTAAQFASTSATATGSWLVPDAQLTEGSLIANC